MTVFFLLKIRYFTNFLPDGPLCRMLAAMYKFKTEQGWRRFDLSSPSRRDANLQMCQKAEEALVEQELHTLPKIAFAKELSKEDRWRKRRACLVVGWGLDFLVCCREKCREVAKRRGLEIVEDESSSTHIVHPPVDMDSEVYCRPVFKKGEKCLVHFYRFPVSGLKSLGSFERNQRQ